MAPRSEVEDGIAIPPAPNWYGSALADWGVGCNDIYAYAARNTIVLLRPNGGGKGSAVGDERPPNPSSSPSRPDRDASFAGTLVGHHNRVTALAFARCPGVEHLLLSGSADRTVRLWDVADGRCVKILRGHAVDVTALATSRGSRTWPCPETGAVSCSCGGSAALTARTRPRRHARVPGRQPRALPGDVAAPVQGRGGVRASERRPGRVRAVRRRSRGRGCPRGRGRAGVRVDAVHDIGRFIEMNPDTTKERGGDPPMVLAVGSREKAVTLWSWDGARTSLRKTLSLPRCPPHLSEAQRARAVAVARVVGDDDDEDWRAEDTAGRGHSWRRAAGEGANGRANRAPGHREPRRGPASMDPRRARARRVQRRRSVTNAPGRDGQVRSNDKAHARTVFIRVKRGAAVTTSLDRSVSVWDVGRCEREMEHVRLSAGFPTTRRRRPGDPFRASVACGDGSLRSLDLHRAGGGGDVLWRGLPQTKATCAAWCSPGRGGRRARRSRRGGPRGRQGRRRGRGRSGTVRGAEGLPRGSHRRGAVDPTLGRRRRRRLSRALDAGRG